MKLVEKSFVFVRHGETDFNKQQTAQGQLDVPLNETGIEQARAAAEILRDHDFASICCSPLKRAHHTARVIAHERPNDLIVIDELAECHLGVGQGTFRGEWFDDWRKELATPEGAEPYGEFLDRAMRGVNLALEHPGPILIVAHGGIFWSIQKYAPLVDKQSVANAVPIQLKPPSTQSDTNWSAKPIIA